MSNCFGYEFNENAHIIQQSVQRRQIRREHPFCRERCPQHMEQTYGPCFGSTDNQSTCTALCDYSCCNRGYGSEYSSLGCECQRLIHCNRCTRSLDPWIDPCDVVALRFTPPASTFCRYQCDYPSDESNVPEDFCSCSGALDDYDDNMVESIYDTVADEGSVNYTFRECACNNCRHCGGNRNIDEETQGHNRRSQGENRRSRRQRSQSEETECSCMDCSYKKDLNKQERLPLTPAKEETQENASRSQEPSQENEEQRSESRSRPTNTDSTKSLGKNSREDHSPEDSASGKKLSQFEIARNRFECRSQSKSNDFRSCSNPRTQKRTCFDLPEMHRDSCSQETQQCNGTKNNSMSPSNAKSNSAISSGSYYPHTRGAGPSNRDCYTAPPQACYFTHNARKDQPFQNYEQQPPREFCSKQEKDIQIRNSRDLEYRNLPQSRNQQCFISHETPSELPFRKESLQLSKDVLPKHRTPQTRNSNHQKPHRQQRYHSHEGPTTALLSMEGPSGVKKSNRHIVTAHPTMTVYPSTNTTKKPTTYTKPPGSSSATKRTSKTKNPVAIDPRRDSDVKVSEEVESRHRLVSYSSLMLHGHTGVGPSKTEIDLSLNLSPSQITVHTSQHIRQIKARISNQPIQQQKMQTFEHQPRRSSTQSCCHQVYEDYRDSRCSDRGNSAPRRSSYYVPRSSSGHRRSSSNAEKRRSSHRHRSSSHDRGYDDTCRRHSRHRRSSVQGVNADDLNHCGQSCPKKSIPRTSTMVATESSQLQNPGSGDSMKVFRSSSDISMKERELRNLRPDKRSRGLVDQLPNISGNNGNNEFDFCPYKPEDNPNNTLEDNRRPSRSRDQPSVYRCEERPSGRNPLAQPNRSDPNRSERYHVLKRMSTSSPHLPISVREKEPYGLYDASTLLNSQVSLAPTLREDKMQEAYSDDNFFGDNENYMMDDEDEVVYFVTNPESYQGLTPVQEASRETSTVLGTEKNDSKGSSRLNKKSESVQISSQFQGRRRSTDPEEDDVVTFNVSQQYPSHTKQEHNGVKDEGVQIKYVHPVFITRKALISTTTERTDVTVLHQHTGRQGCPSAKKCFAHSYPLKRTRKMPSKKESVMHDPRK